MRKIVSGFVLLLVLVISACAAQKEISSNPDISYVQMWRTSCFGKCPNYKIEIFSDGRVRYTGNQFADTGIFEKNIGASAAEKLLGAFSEKRVDTLQNSYPVIISDLPGINYTFKYGNTVKEVKHANFGPDFLKRLARHVDTLVKQQPSDAPKMDDTWRKISDSPKGD